LLASFDDAADGDDDGAEDEQGHDGGHRVDVDPDRRRRRPGFTGLGRAAAAVRRSFAQHKLTLTAAKLCRTPRIHHSIAVAVRFVRNENAKLIVKDAFLRR